MTDNSNTGPAATPATPVALTAHNGTYTVDHPQRGHFTVKLYTVTEGDAGMLGKRILALLVGPDNTSNFRGVGFWNDKAKRVDLWNRHRSSSYAPLDGFNWNERWNTLEKKVAIWVDLVSRGAELERHGFWFDEGYRLLLEGRCVVCNRKLTDPESIRTGIGPTCAGRVGA